jgi:hypothetical protein
VPVLDRLVSISTYHVPGPALCPGAGAAERSQETLYTHFDLISSIFIKIKLFVN